jgi:hypothetical protein
MATPFGYFDLMEAFPGSGCAICRLALRDVEQFLDSLLYEHVNDPDIQRRYRASRGLCNEHSGQLVRHKGNSLGIAILCGAVINELLKITAETYTASKPQLARRLGFQAGQNVLAVELKPQIPCMACRSLEDSQARYVQGFVENFSDTAFRQTYGASSGLCLPHFCRALTEIRNATELQTLVSIQKAIWSKLRAELEEFQAKNDYRRIREKMGAEGDSWLRAIGLIAGEAGVFGLNSQS